MKIITLFTKMQVISKKTYIYGIFHKKSCQTTTLTALGNGQADDNQIKQAISLVRGVSSVTLKRRRKTSMDRAIEDIERGRVYKYDSLDYLIKEIEG